MVHNFICRCSATHQYLHSTTHSFRLQSYYIFLIYASKLKDFVIFSFKFPSFCQLYATYLPPISIGTSSEPHRNLIGISPYNYRYISLLSICLLRQNRLNKKAIISADDSLLYDQKWFDDFLFH